MSFLPPGYEKPASNSRYLKLKNGANSFRILSDAITGYLDWMEGPDGRKPIRTKDKPARSIDPTKPARHFWAFVVWDYAEKTIKILEITQGTIQDGILALHYDEQWGDPKNYDLTIRKTGEKMETKYNVLPAPPKPLSPEVAAEVAKTKVNLEKLFVNGDPFSDEPAQQPQYPQQAEDRSAIERDEIVRQFRGGATAPASDLPPLPQELVEYRPF